MKYQVEIGLIGCDVVLVEVERTVLGRFSMQFSRHTPIKIDGDALLFDSVYPIQFIVDNDIYGFDFHSGGLFYDWRRDGKLTTTFISQNTLDMLMFCFDVYDCGEISDNSWEDVSFLLDNAQTEDKSFVIQGIYPLLTQTISN